MNMTYAEKLRDPRWQKRRLEIMQRDEFACRHCGNKEKTLNVHHAFYERGKSPWDYSDEMLTTLCEDCHSEVEDVIKDIAAFVSSSHQAKNAMMIIRDALSSKSHPLNAKCASFLKGLIFEQ